MFLFPILLLFFTKLDASMFLLECWTNIITSVVTANLIIIIILLTSPCAKICHACSYRSAQFFQDGGMIHRERIVIRLSVDVSCPLK